MENNIHVFLNCMFANAHEHLFFLKCSAKSGQYASQEKHVLYSPNATAKNGRKSTTSYSNQNTWRASWVNEFVKNLARLLSTSSIHCQLFLCEHPLRRCLFALGAQICSFCGCAQNGASHVWNKDLGNILPHLYKQRFWSTPSQHIHHPPKNIIFVCK